MSNQSTRPVQRINQTKPNQTECPHGIRSSSQQTLGANARRAGRVEPRSDKLPKRNNMLQYLGGIDQPQSPVVGIPDKPKRCAGGQKWQKPLKTRGSRAKWLGRVFIALQMTGSQPEERPCHTGFCSQISDWHCCLLFPPDLLLRNAMTVRLVPEGVSVTARDVLTFKYLGSDYQHNFLKEKINMLGE